MDEERLNYPVTVKLFDCEIYDGEWIPGNLQEAISWLQGFLVQIPPEYYDTAEIEIDSVGSYEASHYARICISFKRPPTEEEKAARIERESSNKARIISEERQRYEILKAKYG